MKAIGYFIVLRDTRNGKYKILGETSEHQDPESMLFLWSEGNFSCDCNRSLFFYDDDEEQELPCNPDENIIELISLQSIWIDKEKRR